MSFFETLIIGLEPEFLFEASHINVRVLRRTCTKKYQLFSAKLLVFGPFLVDFYIREISTIVDTQTLATIWPSTPTATIS
jgi:hypothetical protein